MDTFENFLSESRKNFNYAEGMASRTRITKLPITQENEQKNRGVKMDKIDILNRDVFVEQLMKLTENISANKLSICFAINGSWGCGKTFVLDMFQEQLEKVQSEETLSNKYFVIRYNCWKFDYYEEPLVAIVASMLTVIEEKTKLFPEGEKKREILGVLKAISITLLSLGNTVLREKTGVDIQQAYATILDERKEEIGNYL